MNKGRASFENPVILPYQTKGEGVRETRPEFNKDGAEKRYECQGDDLPGLEIRKESRHVGATPLPKRSKKERS